MFHFCRRVALLRRPGKRRVLGPTAPAVALSAKFGFATCFKLNV